MIVYCDFETRSAADLRKTGVYVYADDPTTDVWCMAYSFDGEEPEIWTPDMAPVERLVAHIEAGGALSAFNANFERVIWNKVMAPRYGWPRTKAGQWHCTMALASSKGLPRSLGQVAAVLGLDEQKDKTGQALMMRMARPRKVNDDGTYTWWNTADKVKALIQYCLQDVRTEVAIAEALSEMDGNERQLFLLDQRINDRGVRLDRVLLDKVRVLADTSKAAFDAEIDRLTGGMVSAVTQSTALVAWLRKYGVLTNSVDKQSVAQLLAIEDLHPVIRKVLQLRQDGAKSSTAKLDAMENAAAADDRMRGLLVYHGASTGRWSGKLVQPQNFPRPSKKQDELNEIIEKLKTDQDVSSHGPGTVIASDLLRSMIIAEPGHRLLFADYSAIEARVLAWMAGQTQLVEAFASGGKVYEGMAAVVFDRPESSIGKESVERQVAKALVLGCGFGMSGKRFAEFAKVDEDLALRAVAAYRETNNRIVAYWKETETMYLELGREAVAAKRDYIEVPLPSGRFLTYHNPKIVQRATPWGEMRDTLQVDTLNSITRQWTHQMIWGGLAVENCIAEDTFVLTSNGWKPIQYVTCDDKVHDGVDFVSHSGLVSKSVQTCIEIDGVWMTPDHEVLTDDGWKTAQTKPRPHRPAFWLTGGYAPGTKSWAETFLALSMRLRSAMREGWNGSDEEARHVAELRMSDFETHVGGQQDTRYEPASGLCGLEKHERPMSFADAQSVGELWGAWHNRMRALADRLRGFLGGHGANLSTRTGLGSRGQRWSVLSGKLPMGFKARERHEQAHDDTRSGRSGVVAGDGYRAHDTVLPAEEWLDSGRSSENSESNKQVFDILNAGPRQRFVVLGQNGPFIVHNCVQATARDLMAGAMMRLETSGYPVIMSVHDEIICEVPIGRGSLQEMIEMMTMVPQWAAGCPISAEGKEGIRYEK